MNWFNKIKEQKEAPDDSRDLEKGEVKEILVNSFRTALPDFAFAIYKRQTYFFLRSRTFRGYELYETLNVVFSLQEKLFSCSIASALSKSYLFDSAYQGGFLVGHTDLLAIKSGSGASNIENAYYWHNGKIATVQKVVNQIAHDFRDFGLIYLDRRIETMETSALVREGLDFIHALTVDKTDLKKQIEAELKSVEHVVSRIKHPLFIQLRDTLQRVPNQSREARQQISGLTYELLELYCDK